MIQPLKTTKGLDICNYSSGLSGPDDVYNCQIKFYDIIMLFTIFRPLHTVYLTYNTRGHSSVT